MAEYDDEDPTGVRETTSSVQKATLRMRESKAAAAAYLRIEEAMDPSDIAVHLGYPDGRAVIAAVDRYLQQEIENHPQTAARIRLYVARRLENMLRPVMKKALDGDNPEHLVAVGRAQSLMKQWTDLYGAEAPKQVVVTNPTEEKIRAYAEQLLAVGRPKIETGDIFSDDADDSEVRALEQRLTAGDGEVVQGEVVEDGTDRLAFTRSR